MEKIFLILLTLVIFEFATAAEFTIVEVKRNIPLSDTEPVYKDFYIQVESQSAVKKNATVLVKRKLNIRDTTSKSVGEVETPVGLLKIIAVGPKVAIGRELKMVSRESEAMLEQPFIMVGDVIDTSANSKDFAQFSALKSQVNRKPASSPIQPLPLSTPEKNTQSPIVQPDLKSAESVKPNTEI